MIGFFDVARVVETGPLGIPSLVHSKERGAVLNGLWRNVSSLDRLSGPRIDALCHMVSVARITAILRGRGETRDTAFLRTVLLSKLRLRRDEDTRVWDAGWVEDGVLRFPQPSGDWPWRALRCTESTCTWTPEREMELHTRVQVVRDAYEDALGCECAALSDVPELHGPKSAFQVLVGLDLTPIRRARRELDEAAERREATLATWGRCGGLTVFERARPLWEQAAERKARAR